MLECYQFYNKFINPANICLGEDALKTSWRRLEDVFSVTFFCLPRRLEHVLKTSWRHNCKKSCKHVLKTSWRRFARHLEDVLRMSWRRFRKTYWKCVFKTSSRRLVRRKVLRWRRLEDVLKTSWKTRNVWWEITSYPSQSLRGGITP